MSVAALFRRSGPIVRLLCLAVAAALCYMLVYSASSHDAPAVPGEPEWIPSAPYGGVYDWRNGKTHERWIRMPGNGDNDIRIQ